MIIGNISEFISYDLFKKVENQANIFYNQNPRNRNFNRIFMDTLYGEVSELAVARYFNGTQVPFEISYYDVETPSGEKIEVKHTRYNSKYWNFYSGHYDHFLNNANKLDKIVLVQILDNGDLNLRYIANAKTFHHYIRQSKFEDDVYFIADIPAIQDGNLQVL